MKRVSVAPRTTEWHEIRAESWTASTAAVLVVKENAILLRDYALAKGVTLDIDPLLDVGLESFYENTLWKAWAEKMGRIPRFEGNAHTERGTTNEELVLRKFEEEQMMMVEREVTSLSSEYDGFLASYDALAPASSDPGVVAPYGFPVEAKCPAFGSRKKLWDSKKAGQLAIMGLPYYWCQVQHQIYVAEAPYGWFVAAGVEQDKDTGEEKIVFPIVEKVPRDERFLRAYIAAAKYYHEEFILGCVEPPMLPSDEALVQALVEKAQFERAIHEADLETASDLYLEAVEAEAAASKRRKELEEKVLKAAAAMRAEGDEMVTLSSRLQVIYSTNSSVSWQKVAKDLAKQQGLSDVPEEVIKANTSKARESSKLKEVV
ncbi:general secretion pathway protein GspE [Novimethylophilus kurashikiensis]|uniref:General secretion pathway protein GspE n=1 Tax=Novimethylophilus kurashikiensis TaxID=1825523 RepID=A0A2R5F8I7_9PROT|nr:YqaJ viral recombinase family protein [Novimethylophilus kurashikiensis]GBG14560.1 general secretion pathway protein GspE [Novimethylophilus kurashikiensis]